LTLALLLLHASGVPAQEKQEAKEPPLFTEIAAEVGLDFVHDNGMIGEYYFSEMMGGGGALFDYDGDGDLDVYLVQSGPLGKGAAAGGSGDRLYRNDLEVTASGERRLRFTDVTEESGIGGGGYGMGVAAGDVDNDGWTDLYVTNFGPNRLLRNQGPGDDGVVTFAEVPGAGGADDPKWSVSASFLDYDLDGRLDLFVVDYVDFALATHKPCRSHTGAVDYCSPLAYGPEPDELYRNLGPGEDGNPRFQRVSAASGVHGAFGAGLGVVTGDLDGDGWVDVYVANDQSPNQMWINQGPGEDGVVTFENDALLGGTAVNADGRPEAGMGAAAADVDGDGDLDLLVTHLDRETNTLYLNEGDGFFEDRTVASGIGVPSWDFTGFGLAWLDFDNDGWLDFAVANGAVKHLEPLVRRGDPYPLHQPNQLFRSLGPGEDGVLRFEEVTGRAGPGFALSEVSRGLAAGDVDSDGDADLLVVNNNGPVRLLRNDVGHHRPWLGLRLLTGGRDALGAKVGVVRRGGPTLWRQVQTDGSYAAAGDPRLLVGLGDAAEVTGVKIRWPDGQEEERKVPGTGQYLTWRQGEATAEEHGGEGEK